MISLLRFSEFTENDWNAASICDDGSLIALGAHWNVYVFSMTGQLVSSFKSFGFGVSSLAFVRGGGTSLILVPVCKYDQFFMEVDVHGNIMREFKSKYKLQKCDANKTVIVATTSVHNVAVHDYETGELLRYCGSHGYGAGRFVNPSSVWLHGDKVYVGHSEGFSSFNVLTKECLSHVNLETRVYGVAYNPDDDVVIVKHYSSVRRFIRKDVCSNVRVATGKTTAATSNTHAFYHPLFGEVIVDSTGVSVQCAFSVSLRAAFIKACVI